MSPGSGVSNPTLSEPKRLLKAYAYQAVVDAGGTPQQPTKDSRRLTDFVIEMSSLSPSLNSSLSMSDLVLTPKPSCVRFRTFVKRSSELATAAMTQEVLGCRREAAHLKRTGEGCNPTSGSFAPTSLSATAAA